MIRPIEWDVDKRQANDVLVPVNEDGSQTIKVYFGTLQCQLEYLGPHPKLKGKEAQSSLRVFCLPLEDGSRPPAEEAYKNRLKAVFPSGPTFHHLPHSERGKETTKE